jgi:hypothetical protein
MALLCSLESQTGVLSFSQLGPPAPRGLEDDADELGHQVKNQYEGELRGHEQEEADHPAGRSAHSRGRDEPPAPQGSRRGDPQAPAASAQLALERSLHAQATRAFCHAALVLCARHFI